MSRLFFGIGAILFLLFPLTARAQTDCSPQSQTDILNSMSDTAAAGSITPQTLRNFVCSTLQINIPMGQIYVGSSSGLGAAVTPSGDLTMSPLGVFTLGTLNAKTMTNSTITGGTISGANGSGANVTSTGGTQPRALQDQNQLTAHDFPIVGNGTTDDTTQIQALWNAGATLGKPVFMQPATYGVTCLTAPTGLRLTGAGPSATVIKQLSGACPVIQGTATTDVSISDLQINGNSLATYGIYTTSSAARWRVRNVTVQGTATGASTGDCIHFNQSSDIGVIGSTILNCGLHGIAFDGTSSNFAVTDNNISNVPGAGVIFMVGIDGSIKGNTINVAGPGGDCITGYQNTNLRVAVEGNSCLGSTNNGIHVGGTDISIANNNIYNAALTGIFVAAVTFPGGVKTYGAISNNVTVTGNNIHTITTSNQNGMTLLTCNECAVTGNTVTGATQNGIMIELSNNNAITGNHVGTTTGNGIDLRGSVNNLVAANDVYSSSGDAYRSEQDTTNFTGGGTVNAANNHFAGNYANLNNRDFIDGTGTTGNYYIGNHAAGTISAAPPVWVLGSGSVWFGETLSSTAFSLRTPGGEQVRIQDIANAVNQITLQGGAAGAAPVIAVQGESNRNLNLAAKGTGVVNIQTPLLAAKGLLFDFRGITTGSIDTALVSDVVIGWKSASGAAKTETIPGCTTGIFGTTYTVVDVQGDANTNPIAVTPSSGTIQGGSTFSINTAKGRIQIVCDGTNTNWVQVN